ncbi:uncharacterized protein LOC113359257 [Papaver somniferum]|uniref:uncharacterized protein LOC113359257 n=1 Tax=Papaver somniferum TaxID=3469 RepID=UPI000E6F9E5B|nr:uncharacterized protein LOC113359257 [Papaver somniferum]
MRNNNIIVVLNTRMNGYKWAVLNMYSSCEYNYMSLFWEDMKEIRHWWSGPVCFAGDMNSIRSQEERNRGEADRRNADFLNNFIYDQELVDLPLLDRILLSVDLDLKFHESVQIALARVISDHKPIMWITKPNISCKPYYKFENSWILHKDFIKKVEEWWQVMNLQGGANFVFFKKLNNLKFFLMRWGREEFGGIKKETVELTEKTDSLDLLEEGASLNQEQFAEMTRCCLQLKNIEAMKSRKWFTRAKQNDFKFGDSNTGYFHSIANSRRKRNTIVKLEIDGQECFDQGRIKIGMKNFYADLFSEKNDVAFSLDNMNFTRINEAEKEGMEKEFTEDEVFDVIKKMGANKSSGTDGFSMEFCKSCWHIIGNEFMKMMEEFYRFESWD